MHVSFIYIREIVQVDGKNSIFVSCSFSFIFSFLFYLSVWTKTPVHNARGAKGVDVVWKGVAMRLLRCRSERRRCRRCNVVVRWQVPRSLGLCALQWRTMGCENASSRKCSCAKCKWFRRRRTQSEFVVLRSGLHQNQWWVVVAGTENLGRQDIGGDVPMVRAHYLCGLLDSAMRVPSFNIFIFVSF